MATHCESCEKIGRDHDKVIARCLESPFWVAWYLCGYKDISFVLHWLMTQWVLKGLREGCRRFFMAVTRGHFKTSVMSVAFVTWKLLKDPKEMILFLMHTSGSACEQMAEVKRTFQSNAMSHFFPDRAVTIENRSQLTWTEDRFTVPGAPGSPHCSVTCAGIITGVTGGHYTTIIWDDIIKGEGSDSRMQNNSAMRRIGNFMYLFKDKKKDQIFIWGTPWPGPFYRAMFKRQRWNKLILGALVDDRFERAIQECEVDIKAVLTDEYVKTRILEPNRKAPFAKGTPIFPERETPETIEEARLESPDDFPGQMLCLIGEEGQQKIARNNCWRYDGIHRDKETGPPRFLKMDGTAFPISMAHITATWDPGGGWSGDSDYCGGTVTAWYPGHRIAFLLDAFEDRIEPRLQVAKLLEWGQTWKLDRIGVENVALQFVLGNWLQAEQRRRGIFIPVDPINTGGRSKGERIIDGLRPWIDAHVLRFLPEHDWVINKLVEIEVLSGEIMGESPALADSLWMQTRYWKAHYQSTRNREQDDDIPVDDLLPKPRSVSYGLKCTG